MVVYNIEHNRYPIFMAFIYKCFKPVGARVGILNGKGIYPVVPPIPLPGELSNGHYLYGIDPQVSNLIKPWNYGYELTFGRKRSDVSLIDYHLRNGNPGPAAILPTK